MAVEKLLPAKFAKIKSRQDALQTTFSVFLDIFCPPNFRCFEENGLFQHLQAITFVDLVVNVDGAIRDRTPFAAHAIDASSTVPETRGTIFSRGKGGHVGEESVPKLIQTPDLETRVAILRKRAKQAQVTLPTDVALFIAQNVRSNESALVGALMRLMAHFSLSGTEITLKFTQQVLANFIAAEARKVIVDPLQKLPPGQRGTKEAKIRRQDPTAADRHFVFCLVKTREGRKTSRVRHELEVNMRESERERLARCDAYERELERRSKKRKQG